MMVGQELSIASSFVKQYYTLLNKAPCYIHNFYSQDSTFIHGTIDMGNENCTEPVVGREEIKRKMEELKLNDCRAKIKQIDCLETLAGGLVIQVIGELSNDGKPMRKFLQTFVLAPSPDDSTRNSNNNIKNNNQQPQGVGVDSKNYARANHDISNENNTISRNTNVTGTNNSNNTSNPSQNQKFYVLNSIFRYQDDGRDLDLGVDVEVHATVNLNMKSKPSPDPDLEVAVNPDRADEKKSEILNDSSNEDARDVSSPPSSQTVESGNSGPISAGLEQQVVTTNRPQPSIEHKTWANAVRNSNSSQTNSTKAQVEQQPSQVANQSSVSNQQQQHTQNNNSQPNNNNNVNNNTISNTNSNNNPNNNSNNRRRQLVRKPSNKTSNGRSVKRDRPRPAAVKPSV